MQIKESVKTFHAKTRKAWRTWLEKNHAKEKGVWLLLYKKESNVHCVNYVDAVEEALCFGWIDSIKKKRDEESSIQFFSKRKLNGNWARSNRERVKKLIRQGLMTPAGQRMIDHAKKAGTWAESVKTEKSLIPSDLKQRLDKNSKAFENFQKFPPSSKQLILRWILSAKKPETRQKRIEETVALAVINIRANHYTPKSAKKP